AGSASSRARAARAGCAPRHLSARSPQGDRRRIRSLPIMSHAITTDALSYRAGRHFAIRDLRMRVPNGSVYGFLGPNGSGKTTTIRLLLGMLPPADGTITVLGHDVPRGAHHALARIGYVPERLHLYPMLTVAETMRYHATFYSRWDGAEAERLRRAFDLRDEQRVGRLSKGEAGKLMMLL